MQQQHNKDSNSTWWGLFTVFNSLALNGSTHQTEILPSGIGSLIVWACCVQRLWGLHPGRCSEGHAFIKMGKPDNTDKRSWPERVKLIHTVQTRLSRSIQHRQLAFIVDLKVIKNAVCQVCTTYKRPSPRKYMHRHLNWALRCHCDSFSVMQNGNIVKELYDLFCQALKRRKA